MFEPYPQTYGYSSKPRKRSPSREREGFPKRSRDNDYGRRDTFRREERDYYSRDQDGIDPFKVDYLVPFNQFREYLGRKGNRHVPLEECERRYETYKDNFNKKQIEKFFNKYKNSEWFLEKYHPEESIPIKEQVQKRRLEFLEKYLADLSNGKYDSIDFTDKPQPSSTLVSLSNPSGEDMETNGQEDQEQKKDQEDQDKALDSAETLDEEDIKGLALDEYSLDLNSFSQNSLFIRSVPEFTKRSDVLKLCEKLPGFKYLVFSDPRPDKRMSRLGWIVFEEGTDLESAMKEIDGVASGDFIMHISMNQTYPIRTKFLPSDFSVPERIEKDGEQIKQLALALDKECDFPLDSGFKAVEHHADSLTLNSDGDAEVNQFKRSKKRLDLAVHYLLKVHQYDYYGGVEAFSPEDLNRRISIYHRRILAEGSDKPSPSEFSSKLDIRVHLRLCRPLDGENEEFVKLGARPMEEHLESCLARRIKKESEGKFRCVECEKLFKGEEFVKKHLRSKHEDIIASITAETLLFNAFLLNPCKTDLGRPPHPNPSYSQRGNGPRYREYGREPLRDTRMPPPNRTGRPDPRQIRSYQDLDAPVDGDIQLQYD